MVRVIPVLDVMGGLVVHAVAGRREEYRPLKGSVIASSPEPRALLEALRSMGFTEVYVADLDAITGKGGNPWVLDEACSLGLHVLADVGRRGLDLEDSSLVEYVVGTEYLDPWADLERARGRVISLDVFQGLVKFRDKGRGLGEALSWLSEVSARRLLLIDLSRVGTMSGPDLDLVGVVREAYRGELIVGGGVRGVEDILALEELGVDAVLVATAIHRGLVTRTSY